MRELGFKTYFKDSWNKIDIIMGFLNLVYVIQGLNHYILGISKHPLDIILLILLFTFSFFKLMSYMRIYKEFGQLVWLLQVCIAKVTQFVAFLVGWILFFALFYIIAGVEFDEGDYDNLSPTTIVFLQTFRNSIGDIATPKYPVWSIYIQSDDESESFLGHVMITTIWIFWFIHIFVILILLLNFLIAIIS